MPPKCHICSQRSKFFMIKKGYSLYRCKNCNLIFVYPQPSKKFLEDKVYSAQANHHRNKPKKLAKTKEDKKTKKILEYLSKENLLSKLLDIGCSNGQFLYHAQKRGIEVYGVEINKHAVSIARKNNLKVFHGKLKESHFPKNFFDFVFLGDILEHVQYPRNLLKKCKRILKNNGLIVISTPNSNNFWSKATLLLHKLLNIPWSTTTHPYHLFQFNEKNLDILLNQLNFKNQKKWFYRPLTLKYELGSTYLWKKFKNNKTLLNFFFMLFSFSLYSILYGVDIIIIPFKSKKLGLIVIYKLKKPKK